MFGLHGIVVQTDVGEGLDAKSASPQANITPIPEMNLTIPIPLKPKKSLIKNGCKIKNGHIIFSQVNIYNITFKCIICPKHSVFNKSNENCFCLPGYYMRN